jgi:hypothetical protein
VAEARGFLQGATQGADEQLQRVARTWIMLIEALYTAHSRDVVALGKIVYAMRQLRDQVASTSRVNEKLVISVASMEKTLAEYRPILDFMQQSVADRQKEEEEKRKFR